VCRHSKKVGNPWFSWREFIGVPGVPRVVMGPAALKCDLTVPTVRVPSFSLASTVPLHLSKTVPYTFIWRGLYLHEHIR
jgi:hypothetical protein